MTMRRNIIALSLFEAAKLLHEQEMPQPTAGAATTPTDPETGEPIDLDAIIERLNIIRSGKSFSDPEVYGKLTTMFKSMPESDRTTLHTQLKSIGAIVQSQAVPGSPEVGPPAPEAALPPAPAPTPAGGAGPAVPAV